MSNWTIEDLKRLGIDENGKRVPKSNPEIKIAVIGAGKPPTYNHALALEIESKYNLNPDQENDVIFIPGHVPSSKNNKQAFVKVSSDDGKYRPGITDNKRTKDYRTATITYWRNLKKEFLEQAKDLPFPLKVEFMFVRKSNQRADFHNLIQILCDLMVEHGWIPDDDMKHLMPYPPSEHPYYLVDKGGEGVYIRIIK